MILRPCPSPPTLKTGTIDEIAEALIELAGLYYDCKDRHAAAAAALRAK